MVSKVLCLNELFFSYLVSLTAIKLAVKCATMLSLKYLQKKQYMIFVVPELVCTHVLAREKPQYNFVTDSKNAESNS